MVLEASSGSAVPENGNFQKAAAASKANKKGKAAAERETMLIYYSGITCCICICKWESAGKEGELQEESLD